jgi:hypothetical protein
MDGDKPVSTNKASEIAALRIAVILARDQREEDLTSGRTDLVARRDGEITKMEQRLKELNVDE